MKQESSGKITCQDENSLGNILRQNKNYVLLNQQKIIENNLFLTSCFSKESFFSCSAGISPKKSDDSYPTGQESQSKKQQTFTKLNLEISVSQIEVKKEPSSNQKLNKHITMHHLMSKIVSNKPHRKTGSPYFLILLIYLITIFARYGNQLWPLSMLYEIQRSCAERLRKSTKRPQKQYMDVMLFTLTQKYMSYEENLEKTTSFVKKYSMTLLATSPFYYNHTVLTLNQLNRQFPNAATLHYTVKFKMQDYQDLQPETRISTMCRDLQTLLVSKYHTDE